MLQSIRKLLLVGLTLSVVHGAGAFSLLGPFKGAGNPAGPDTWQDEGFGGRPEGLGYAINSSIGGPMFPIEAYRWNVPVITYAFDESFIRYFGPNGISAVEEAFAILNGLPPASQMSETLSEFPLDTKGRNDLARSLGLRDVKSTALSVLLEEMGLANPERYTWGLRDRVTGQGFTNYSVIQMNFDPVTLNPTPYVNGVLYNYRIFDALGPQGDEWASALEWYQLDPLVVPYSSVAGGFGSEDFQLGASPDEFATFVPGLGLGEFFTGLTRDDVGGLRFLLHTNNLVIETLLTNVIAGSGSARSSGGSPWSPVGGGATTNAPGGTNVVATTNLVRVALRAGRDKITFERVDFDSLLGQLFRPIANRYSDRFMTNGRVAVQSVQRVITVPDIIFAVQDLGTIDEVPALMSRTDTSGWQNDDAVNGVSDLGGPGVITPPVVIAFTDLLPFFLHGDPPFPDDLIGPEPQLPILWGSFNASADPPIVYPAYLSISLEDIQDAISQRRGD